MRTVRLWAEPVTTPYRRLAARPPPSPARLVGSVDSILSPGESHTSAPVTTLIDIWKHRLHPLATSS